MTLTFGAICSLLQSVENISTRDPRLPAQQEKENIREAVADWFTHWRSDLDESLAHGGAVLSIVFPHRRKDRVYNHKAPRLAKRITKLLNFNSGQRLLFDGWSTAKLGDLGVYLERAMKPWDHTFSTKCEFSIDKMDRFLVQLAATSRFSDPSIRRKRTLEVNIDIELRNILVRLESWEAKWFVRLILRDYCTVALGEKHFLQSYHFLLPDLLQFQNDFEVVFGMLCNDLAEYPSVPDPSQEAQLRVQAGQLLRPIVGTKIGRPAFYKAWSINHCFQMAGQRAWAAEVKYDGEYCEIHIDLDKAPHEIKIFSKNGKDATIDRGKLIPVIRTALRIGQPDCLFKKRCIVLGEMVPYSDREKKILPFHKIRKHVARSGSFMNTLQDSLPHAWERLMIVFFDVLMLDDTPVLRQSLQDRRRILRDLVHTVPGRSLRSEWTLLDFKTRDGETDLKQVFARSLAQRQEGLILKPLNAPYFPLISDRKHDQAGYFIKVKKDYLADMGGERDLGDFAIIGASFDPQIAPKCDVKPLHWTHFCLGCCINKADVERVGARPKFKVVATLSAEHSIPKPDVKYLNIQGHLRQVPVSEDDTSQPFEVEHLNDFGRRMTVIFKSPFVAEVLGGGFEKAPNEDFEMLRHPRIRKIHNDRTWEDCVTMADLECMATEKWQAPDADKLDGHAKDVALLVKKYLKQMNDSQASISTCKTTQQTTQRSEEITPVRSQRRLDVPSDATVHETQQDSSTQSTVSNRPTKASRAPPVLVRVDTSERIDGALPRRAPCPAPLPTPTENPQTGTILTTTNSNPPAVLLPTPNPTPPSPPTTCTSSSQTGKRTLETTISPPTTKRRKLLTPLCSSNGNTCLGSVEWESQEGIIHVYAKKGVSVYIHSSSETDEEL